MKRSLAMMVLLTGAIVVLAQSVPSVPALPKQPEDRLSDLAKEREKLRKEIDETKKQLVEEDNFSEERKKLREQLDVLLKKLAEGPKFSDKSEPKKKNDPAEPKTLPKINDKDIKPIDAVAAAMNLYKANDFEAASRAFKLIDLNTLIAEDRVFVQYMTACSLRRWGKLSEAAAIYREVAASDVEYLAEFAKWQLETINWRTDMENQLKQLRDKRTNPGS